MKTETFILFSSPFIEERLYFFSNPLSYDKDALELFLKNNRETLENYFNDENNHGIAFHECGFSGKAQDEFIQSWMDSGVRVF